MAYYVKNQTSTDNISLKDLYKMKGVNQDYDKTNNFRLAPYGSNTEGSHLGPSFSPWLSADFGNAADSNRAFMIEFNDPDAVSGVQSNPSSKMSSFRNVNYRYTPWKWGDRAVGDAPIAQYGNQITTNDIIDDSGLAPGYTLTPQLKWYALERDGLHYAIMDGNWISIHRRSTTNMRLTVGIIDGISGGTPSQYESYASSDFAATNGSIALANIGAGDGNPYNEGGALGSSTQAVVALRSTSNTTQYRVVTLNTNASATPTISVGSANTFSNQGGNPVFAHQPNGINMGKGIAWNMAHRGANWIRIFYVKLNGTTVSNQNGITIANLSSTTTVLNGGSLIKISDESALIIAAHRNGASSGNGRRIVAHSLGVTTNGAPSVRSSFLTSYDWGATDTQFVGSAAGSGPTDGIIWGLSVYQRSGNSTYFMPWSYRASTDTFTFKSAQLIDDTGANSTDGYRMRHSVIHLGFNPITESNYYHVVIAGNNGDYHYNVAQDVGNDGALDITQRIGILNSSWRRSAYSLVGHENAMGSYLDGGVNSEYGGKIYPISGITYGTNNYVYTTGILYSSANVL
jgi:hypothetical protein